MDPAAPPAEFHPFTLTHALTVGVCAAITIALLTAGTRGRGTPLGVATHRAWLAFVIIVQLINIIYFALPPQLDPATSLPLHICDLAGLLAIADLLWKRRILMTLMLYWGVGLSLQGFILPVVREGPDTFRFHLFFASHLSIVATGLYDVVVRQYRPTWRDCTIAFTLTMIYTAIILPLNLLTGWNYGYIANPTPPAPNPTAFLGPWPLRVVWMVLLGFTGFAMLTLVCRLRPKAQAQAPPHPYARP